MHRPAWRVGGGTQLSAGSLRRIFVITLLIVVALPGLPGHPDCVVGS